MLQSKGRKRHSAPRVTQSMRRPVPSQQNRTPQPAFRVLALVILSRQHGSAMSAPVIFVD